MGANSLPSSRASVALSSDIMSMKLRYFASKKSHWFFNAAGISPTFLHWDADDDSQSGLRVVSHFEIVTDAAKEECSL